MLADSFGPFATIVAIALALVAVFAQLAPRMIGKVSDWNWLAADSPSFVSMAGARIVCVVLMAIAFVTANAARRPPLIGAALVAAVLGLVCVRRFDLMRRVHTVALPIVGKDGKPTHDKKGKNLSRYVVIGSEADMLPNAKDAFDKARDSHGVSLLKFMSGFGSTPNDPEALWDHALLARIAAKLSGLITYVVLLAVMALFLAALLVSLK
jgi:hypothetical protein